MRKLLLLSGVLCLAAFPISAHAEDKAKAELLDAKGASVGAATLVRKPGGVQLDLKAWNLPPGVHGFHIHNVGMCEAPDFKSAGPHFNPEGKQHGWDNPQGHHLGDLQNLRVGADGKASARILISGATLGGGANSLFHDGGTAIVIHEKPDDMKTDPAGNAGARIACGVIAR
jgi:Cu-Zn family superoxide dismutase